MSAEDWPYDDLTLKCPHCPECGEPARMMVGGNIMPIAFCPAEECRVFTWNPTEAAAVFIRAADAGEIPVQDLREGQAEK